MSAPGTASVIVTAFRRVEFLRGAIRSVLAQTRPPLEVIVTDDGADPAIRDLVAQFDAGPVLRYRSNPQPIGAAGNVAAALRECNGDRVAILNDDDLWEPPLLAALGDALDSCPGSVVAFADHWLMDAGGHRDVVASHAASERYGRADLEAGVHHETADLALMRKAVPTAISALFRRDAFRADEIPSDVRGAYDFWIAVRCAATRRPFVYVPERLASWRLHDAMESRRPSPTGSEGHLRVWQHILARDWFPELRREVMSRLAYVHSDCGIERLLHRQTAAAVREFGRSFRLHPSRRAAAGLALACVPFGGHILAAWREASRRRAAA